jgi:hypothetical protein
MYYGSPNYHDFMLYIFLPDHYKFGTKENSHSLQGLYSWKIPKMSKLQYSKLRPYGKIVLREPKTWNMIMCKVTINKHVIICQCLLAWHQCSWLKVVTVIKWCRHTEERADLWLLYFLLHALIHPTMWCHDSPHLHLPATHTRPFQSFWERGHTLHKKFSHSFFFIVDLCTP